jgi:hypothetical protein
MKLLRATTGSATGIDFKSGAANSRTALPGAPLNRITPASLQASASNDTNQYHHDRDNQEDMNESAHGVRADKTQQPEDNQDDCNGLKHFASPFLSELGEL